MRGLQHASAMRLRTSRCCISSCTSTRAKRANGLGRFGRGRRRARNIGAAVQVEQVEISVSVPYEVEQVCLCREILPRLAQRWVKARSAADVIEASAALPCLILTGQVSDDHQSAVQLRLGGNRTVSYGTPGQSV